MKTMFAKVLMLMVLISLALGGAALAEKSYVNGIDANFPPFSFVNKQGEPDGFDIQAVNWIAEEMGFEVTHKPMAWDTIIPNLQAKKIDLIASGMSITEERQKKVNFSTPYWTVDQVFVVPEGSELTVDDILTGDVVLGAQSGTPTADWLEAQVGEKENWNYDLRYYDSQPLAVTDLINGRIKAAAMDDVAAKDAARKKPLTILGTFGYKTEKFGYAVRKEDTELLKTLNAGLKKLMDDPYWDELIETYKPGH